MNECYIANFASAEFGDRDKIWKVLWKTKIQERLKVFLWRILVGALPTRCRIFSMTGVGEQLCGLCNGEIETEIHLFKEC